MAEGVDANIIGAAVGSNYWKQGERGVNKLQWWSLLKHSGSFCL